MGYKDVRSRYLLMVRVVILIALIGLGVLVFANIGEDPSHVTFSLIAFGIGVAALLITMLQSVTIYKQMQMTEKAVREVRETGDQLEKLVRENMQLEKEVEEDIELDHKIIAVLEEHAVGDDDAARRVMAKKIAQNVKK
jgi:ABC-type multidrug transport system fused ATPase/permease subunit